MASTPSGTLHNPSEPPQKPFRTQFSRVKALEWPEKALRGLAMPRPILAIFSAFFFFLRLRNPNSRKMVQNASQTRGQNT